MARIIADVYVKENKQILGDDPKSEFNRKILAVNDMYGWLYEKGILEQVSFEFKDYEEAAYFALDTKDLEPYRREMGACMTRDADLAVRHIFDEPYTPCAYSGAVELGWTMSSYRGVDGCVGRSWECGLVKNLDTDGIYRVAKVRDEQGVQAAVSALFAEFDWEPTLAEEKAVGHDFSHVEQPLSSIISSVDQNRFTDTTNAILCFDTIDGQDVVCVDLCYDCRETLRNCDVVNLFQMPHTQENIQTARLLLDQLAEEYRIPVHSELSEDKSVHRSNHEVAETYSVTLTKQELDMIKKSLDVMGDQLADREGYSSGEEYWDLKEKLADYEGNSPICQPIDRIISDASSRIGTTEHDAGTSAKEPTR